MVRPSCGTSQRQHVLAQFRMPVGIQRINAKKSQPNPLIVFIKPLKGPDEAVAQDFLERIAAQCCESSPRASPRAERLAVITC